MKPKIIILSGIPASGKSTWATNHFKCNHWTTKIISRDTIREIHFPQPYIYTKESENRVTEIFNEQLKSYTEFQWDIIIDNTNCKEQYIDALLFNALEKYPLYNVYIKFFDIPLWKAIFRAWNRKRKTGKNVPFKVIKQMHKNYKKINQTKYSTRIL